MLTDVTVLCHPFLSFSNNGYILYDTTSEHLPTVLVRIKAEYTLFSAIRSVSHIIEHAF